MCRTVMPLGIGLMPCIMKLEIGEQGGHDPWFQDDRFAGHILAFAMNLQEMVPLVEIEVPTLGAGELDTAEADRTPEDGEGIIAKGQLLLFPRLPISRHGVEEPSDLLFTEAVPNEAFGDPEAADLVHGIPGEFALVDHPATEATEGRKVKIHRPRFDGVAQIGLIDAEQGDRQGCGLAITAPPFEEPPEGLAVGHDGRGRPIAGEKALHDGADMVVGGRRADRRVIRPAEDGDLVFLDPTGGPLQGPGLRRLLDRQERLDGQRSSGVPRLLLIVRDWLCRRLACMHDPL